MVYAREGSKGAAVSQVQTMLNFVMAAAPALAVDGVFGAKTRARVVEFQKKKQLTADGIVGPKTGAALMAAASQRLFTPRSAALL